MSDTMGDGEPTIDPTIPPTALPISTAKWGALVAGLLIVVGVAWYVGGSDLIKSSGSGKVSGANSSYQAVFLTNGQVYFGKLESSVSSLILRDIYYLKVTQALQPAGDDEASAQPNIQLVKLGSELHGPEDVMYLQQDKVLFWENMKDGSKVVEAIKKYQETKK